MGTEDRQFVFGFLQGAAKIRHLLAYDAALTRPNIQLHGQALAVLMNSLPSLELPFQGQHVLLNGLPWERKEHRYRVQTHSCFSSLEHCVHHSEAPAFHVSDWPCMPIMLAIKSPIKCIGLQMERHTSDLRKNQHLQDSAHIAPGYALCVAHDAAAGAAATPQLCNHACLVACRTWPACDFNKASLACPTCSAESCSSF